MASRDEHGLGVDPAQVRGVLRALRELREGVHLGESAPHAAPIDPARRRRQGGPLTIFLLLGVFACLTVPAALFSGGRGASMSRSVPSFRPSVGGPLSTTFGPVGPEQESMHRSILKTAFVIAAMATAGGAVAQDATFMSSDTISVQGWTNTPDEITIECRIWMPARGGGGSVYAEQRNSFTSRHLAVFPTFIRGALYGVTPFGNDPVFPCTMPLGAWSHVALVRKSTQVKAFLNGQLIGTSTCSAGTIALTDRPDLRIGAHVHNDAGYPESGFIGRIDWLRVSSVARYTANFTVPTEDSLIPADASTELLLRFNEAPGASQVQDDSPHHFASVVGDPSKFPIGTATAPRFPGPLSCPSDLDGDGAVNGADVALLLLDFGPCP